MAVRRMLDTPPLVTSADGPTVLSMVHHRDVLPYLLAIKSFVRHVPSSRIVVIADPTITTFDRTVLSQHIPALDLRDAVTPVALRRIADHFPRVAPTVPWRLLRH